jgi:hypothetical protein
VKTGVQEISKYLKTLDVLARLGSLRLPSVARPEFIPMKIGAGMTEIGQKGLFTRLSNFRFLIGEFFNLKSAICHLQFVRLYI